MNGQNQIQTRNQIDKRNQRGQPRRGQKVEERRERSVTFLWDLIQEHSKKEKRERYCLLSCRTRLVTIRTLYPWIDNSSQERRGRSSSIIIIRMVPVGQYIIHRTRHTILIVTSSRMDNHEWSLHCHMCGMSYVSRLHRHIEQSTASPNRTYMLGIIL